MKILMISDVYFPRVNGVSTSIQTFTAELQRLGHDMLLIAPAYPGASADEPGVMRIPAHTVPLDPEDRVMRDVLIGCQRRGANAVTFATPAST